MENTKYLKNKQNPEKDKQALLDKIKSGKIFIYPTDTIYGLGCNALNSESVKQIKEIKSRDKDKPLSIIAPSLKWIEKNLIIPHNTNLKKYLPGPYTLILKKKKKNFLKHVSSTDSLGIRIPDCNFSLLIQETNLPFITTSVNLSGEKFAKNIKEISKKIKNKVDVIINEGELNTKPSTLVINGKEIKR